MKVGKDKISKSKWYNIFFLIVIITLVIPSASAYWSSPIKLTFNTVPDDDPSINSDGSKIAFRSNLNGRGEIFIINSDGTGLDQLTYNGNSMDWYPSISADGSKIAFQRHLNNYFQIFTVNSDGTDLKQLTFNDANHNNPSISADGSKIAFPQYLDSEWGIFVVNSDGTGLQQLTSNTAAAIYPTINADGSMIAFQQYINSELEYSIFTVKSDGSDLLQLTPKTIVAHRPSISSDGSKIAFEGHVNGNWEIFVINSDGTGLIQLTHNTITDGRPSINADGSKIAFHSQIETFNFEICVINSDGTGLIQLTHNSGHDMGPSINAIGDKIAFVSGIDGDYEIFIVSNEQNEFIPAIVDVKQDTLNKASQGDIVTAYIYIELPGYDVNEIDISTVTLSTNNGKVSALLSPTEVGDYNSDGIPDRMVKFDRQAIIGILDIGVVVVTISGKIADESFEGTDEIQVRLSEKPNFRIF